MYYADFINRTLQLFLLAAIVLSALTAQDTAMWIINTEKECALETEGGESRYVSFGLGTWMNVASVTHFIMVLLIVMSVVIAIVGVGISDDDTMDCSVNQCCCRFLFGITNVIYCAIAMACLFLLAWTVIGLIFYAEIQKHGVNNHRCREVLLGWIIMYSLSVFCVFCTGNG